MAKNPVYAPLVEQAPDGEPGCVECGSRLVSPDHCAKCHGERAMVSFCPNCEMDCGCEEWQ